jgi:hypothetical protein
VAELISILIGALAASLLLLVEHVTLWPYKCLPHYTARYVLGTAALGLGLTIWATITDRLIAAVAFWAIAGCGGATVIIAYWVRGQLAKHDREAFTAGQVAGLPIHEDADGPARRSDTRRN